METGKQGSRIMLREYGATDHIVHNNRLTITTPTRTKHYTYTHKNMNIKSLE